MNIDKLKNITIQQLETVIYLIQERSFSRAAKKMLLTQPSLTKHIKNLESTIGSRIINRENSGVSLTAEGKLIYEYAQKVIGLREELKEKIVRSQDNETGNIEVIASTIPATYILPHILSKFNKQYPEIHIYIKTANSDESLDIILNHDAAIGFIGKKPLHRKLYAEPVWKDRMILAVPTVHDFKEIRFLTADELMRVPFVIREKGSGTRQILEEYVKEKTGDSPRFQVAAELGSSEAIKEAIIAGLGVSIISIHAIRRELKQKLIAEAVIEDWKIERDFFLIYRKQFSLMRHHHLFLDFVRATGNTFDFL